MNGIPKAGIVATAVAAILLASGLAACGGDNDPAAGIESGTTGQNGASNATGENGNPAGGGTGNGPASSGDRNPDAPDQGISEKPGGPDPSYGSQKDGKSNRNGKGDDPTSGGITLPPQPSQAAP